MARTIFHCNLPTPVDVACSKNFVIQTNQQHTDSYTAIKLYLQGSNICSVGHPFSSAGSVLAFHSCISGSIPGNVWQQWPNSDWVCTLLQRQCTNQAVCTVCFVMSVWCVCKHTKIHSGKQHYSVHWARDLCIILRSMTGCLLGGWCDTCSAIKLSWLAVAQATGPSSTHSWNSISDS